MPLRGPPHTVGSAGRGAGAWMVRSAGPGGRGGAGPARVWRHHSSLGLEAFIVRGPCNTKAMDGNQGPNALPANAVAANAVPAYAAPANAVPAGRGTAVRGGAAVPVAGLTVA